MMFCCLRNCFDGLGFAESQTPKREPNPIALDTCFMGNFNIYDWGNV